MPKLMIRSLPLLSLALSASLVSAQQPAAPQQRMPQQRAPQQAAPPAGPQAGQTPTGQTEAGQQRPPARPMAVSPEMDAVLARWEEQSSKVQRLTGVHYRYVYDTVSGVEKRGTGEYWFEAPDKGRLDLKAARVEEGQTNPRMKTKDGQPYKVTADTSMSWVCTGAEVLQIEEEQKGFYRTEIPPQLRGQNIMESPLPFLFGMKAAEVKARYRLEFGDRHTYQPGTSGQGQTVHLKVYPTRRSDATNWSEANVYLDGTYFLPLQISLRDPYGTQMTRYVFDRDRMKANKKGLFERDPFRPRLFGYKLLGEQTASRPQPGTEGAVSAR